MFKKLIYLVSFILVLGLVQTSIAQDADSNLAGWWKFDGDADDSSGNGRHGTLLGNAQFEPGVFGQAVALDGGVDIVGYKGIVADQTDPNNHVQPAFSIALWVKTNGNAHLMGWGTNSATQHVRLRIGSGRLRVQQGNANRQGDTVMIDGEWHHVAMTAIENATISHPEVILYLDGQDDTRPGTSGNGFDIDVAIGRNFTGGGALLGSMDEVRLYDKVLTPEEVQLLATRYKAYNPDPNDGDVVNETWGSLGWTPGDTAVSHDVYFGDNFDNVNDGTGGTSVGNKAMTMLIVGLGMPGDPLPTGFTPGTTYYWRIDEVEADGTTVHKGDVWSFYVPPHTAYDPDPPDGATFARTDLLLSWLPGLKVMSHDLYFGTNLADVTDGTVPTASGTDPNYATGPLANDTAYYWRVDENDGVATYKGDVSSFTTMPAVPVTTEPGLIALWTFDEGAGSITAVDWSGHENNGILRKGPQWVADGHDGGALLLDGRDDYLAIENMHYDSNGLTDLHYDSNDLTEVSVCTWLRTSRASDQFIVSFDRNEYYRLEINGSGAGDGQVGWDVMTDTGQVDYGSIRRVDDGGWHHVAGVFDNGTLTIYIDGRPEPSASGGATYGTGTTRYGFIGANSEASGFDSPTPAGPPIAGELDDLCIYDRALSEAEIVDMAAGLSAQAPLPYDGSTLTDATPTLSWLSGTNTAAENGHELYFSADVNAVTDRTADKVVLSEPNYAITTSLGAGTYYWAVDQVEADGVTIHAGPVWSFTVVSVITVGPIESLDAIANPVIPDMLLAPLAINGIDVSGLVQGTTTADFEKYADHPAADADNLGLTTYASLDEATLVKTVFDVPVTTIFILELGADDSGFLQPIDANDIPIGAPLAFTAADFHFEGTDTLKIAGQPAGGMAIVADVPINGIEITPPIDGPLGIDPAIIAAIPVPAE